MRRIICFIGICALTLLLFTNLSFANSETTAITSMNNKVAFEEISEEEEEELELLFQTKINESKQRKLENNSIAYEYSDFVWEDFSKKDAIALRGYYDEVEPNDRISLADRCDLGQTTYGRISKSGDVDYFRIKFDSSGLGGGTLRDIPSNCDYDLYFLSSDGDILSESTKSRGKDESVAAAITEDVYYYFRVEGYGEKDYDDELEYSLTPRFRNISEYAISVGCDYAPIGGKGLTTLADAKSSSEKIAKLGFQVKEVCTPSYSTLSELFENYEMGVAFFSGHGFYNRIYYNSRDSIIGDYATGISTNFDKFDEIPRPHNTYVPLSDMDLDRCRLMVFSSCYSAENDDGLGLARYANKKGVDTTIGWVGVLNSGEAEKWNKYFWDSLISGSTVYEAARKADSEKYLNDSVRDYRIYGNYAGVIQTGKGDFRDDIEVMRISQEKRGMLKGGQEIYVNVENNDLKDITCFVLEQDKRYSADDYNIKVHQVADDLYNVRFTLYVDGFRADYGYMATVENNEVTYIAKFGQDQETETNRRTAAISVSQTDIELAKEKAALALPEEVQLKSQTTENVIDKGEYFVFVTSVYSYENGGEDSNVYRYKL